MNLLAGIGVSAAEYRTVVEEVNQIASFAGLAPYDRHELWRERTLAYSPASREHFLEWPVPIEDFVSDPYYVGADVLVRPKIKEFLSDFWAPENAYEVFAFVGGLGSGKSFSASLSLAYAVYQLSVLRRPLKYLNRFPGISLTADSEIVLMSASAAGARQASKVVYGEVFQRIETSTYFNQHFQPYQGKGSELEFPNRIRLAPGTSQWQSALGWNLWGFIVDEAALGLDTERADYVKELFSNLNKRRLSRFKSLGFGGLFTSPGSEHSYVETIAGEGSSWDATTMVRRISTWEASDELVPGAKVFLLERQEPIRVIEGYTELIFRGWEEGDGGRFGVAQRQNGEVVRWKAATDQDRQRLNNPELETAAA
jgi:hypothetical protein